MDQLLVGQTGHGFHYLVTILGLGYCVSSSLREKDAGTFAEMAEGSSFFQENWNAKIKELIHTSKWIAKLFLKYLKIEEYHFLNDAVKLRFTIFADYK